MTGTVSRAACQQRETFKPLFLSQDALLGRQASSRDPLYSDLSVLDSKVPDDRIIKQSLKIPPPTNQIYQSLRQVQTSSCHPLTQTIPTSSLYILTLTQGFLKTLTILQTTHINFPTNIHLSSNRAVALPQHQLQPTEEVLELQLQLLGEPRLHPQPQFPMGGTATMTTSTMSVQDPTVTGFRFLHNLCGTGKKTGTCSSRIQLPHHQQGPLVQLPLISWRTSLFPREIKPSI